MKSRHTVKFSKNAAVTHSLGLPKLYVEVGFRAA